jgi:hypothetical protein
MAMPPGIIPGAAARVILRGLRLDKAAEIRFLAGEKAAFSVRPLEKVKAEVPAQQNPNRIGDTQLSAEVALPAGTPGPYVSFVVVSPDGESPPHRLWVDGGAPLAEEKEPNDQFRKPQAVQIPFFLAGKLERPQDVDVFRFEGKAGERLAFKAAAQVFGSPADTLLTLYDSAGHLIADGDDQGESTDALLQVTLKSSGHYFLCLQDANDQGSPFHFYRLTAAAAR